MPPRASSRRKCDLPVPFAPRTATRSPYQISSVEREREVLQFELLAHHGALARTATGEVHPDVLVLGRQRRRPGLLEFRAAASGPPGSATPWRRCRPPSACTSASAGGASRAPRPSGGGAPPAFSCRAKRASCQDFRSRPDGSTPSRLRRPRPGRPSAPAVPGRATRRAPTSATRAAVPPASACPARRESCPVRRAAAPRPGRAAATPAQTSSAGHRRACRPDGRAPRPTVCP